MKTNIPMIQTTIFLVIFLLQGMTMNIFSQPAPVPFDEAHWDLSEAKQTEFQGRACLTGNAYLKNTAIENGVVEVDMAVTGDRSYPGILFRIAGAGDYERIYLRPHLPAVFRNVVQYVSTFNDIDSWQLYSGTGNCASAEIPKEQWFHVKVEFHGEQARIFIGNAPTPALEVTHLGHGTRRGSLGLSGPMDGSAYFSNFSFREDNALTFKPVKPLEIPFGTICEWEISPVYKLSDTDFEMMPEAQGIMNIPWKPAHCRPDGMVDVSQVDTRKGSTPDLIFAKTNIESSSAENKLYAFGYSDLISVFLNGELLFCGNSAYTSRDPNFQGIVGLNDYINLPLKKGKNELMIALAESFGGWGFIFREAKAVYQSKQLVKKWELKNRLKYPESVQYDPKREVLYVSNLYNDGREYISKVNMSGEIIENEWVTGILQPTGMYITGDKLYAVGRYALIEIDPEKGAIVNRYRFPDPGMPNDVTADDLGNLYITDSQKGLIYRLAEGKMEVWLQIGDLVKPNGILYDRGKLLIGTSGDGCIKVIDPATKSVSILTSLGEGTVMDGIAAEGNGNYLISDYAGKLYRINGEGKQELLLNSTTPGQYCAAFEYIPSKKLLVIPTLEDNRLIAYELK